jgi:hypothetical protein
MFNVFHNIHKSFIFFLFNVVFVVAQSSSASVVDNAFFDNVIVIFFVSHSIVVCASSHHSCAKDGHGPANAPGLQRERTQNFV